VTKIEAAGRVEQSARHALVLGGARSGKTRRALALAEGARHRVYVATAEAFDDEMRARIRAHREERAGGGWATVEAPVDLAGALGAHAIGAAVGSAADLEQTCVVVDCLTLWLSNLMLGEQDISRATVALLAALGACPARVVLVSNEVGFGIVPDNALARRFRDAQGRLNQQIAAAVGQVELVVAGLPLRLK
jgi:adenosylcobinamide kinase/adenosylcobinamide-phosphate guanylyltransferase